MLPNGQPLGVSGLTLEERLKALFVYADQMGIERLGVYRA